MKCKYCGKNKGGYQKRYHLNCKVAYEKALDDNDILYGNDAKRFLKNMKAREEGKMTKKEKELFETVRKDSVHFDVQITNNKGGGD